METDPQRPTGREDTISAMNAAIAALNLAQKNSNIAATKAIFRTAADLLTTTLVCFSLFCDNRCQAHNLLGLNPNG